MKAIHVSDWHSGFIQTLGLMRFWKLERDEDMELVLVTGDMLPNFPPMWVPGFETEQANRQYGLWKQIAAHFQETWPNADIVAVPGNHDWCNYTVPGLVRSFDKLGTQTIEVRGKRISGFPGRSEVERDWHGELREEIISDFIHQLDFSADIFLTHTPPYGILDKVNEERFIGAQNFAEFFVNNPWIKTRYHCFGHVHESGGSILRQNNMIYSTRRGILTFWTLNSPSRENFSPRSVPTPMPPLPPPSIRIAAAMWTPAYNVLGMVCACGNRFAHRVDRWTVRCSQCKRVENLGVIRSYYVEKGFENV